MRVELLRLDSANKSSLISESVTEIRINNQLYKGINLTPWHMQARRAPWVATIHDVTKKPGWVLPHPSASNTRMPRRTHRGWPEHYPIIHPWSKVRYCTTRRHTKLLSLGIPYVPYALVHFKCLFIRTQPTRALIDTGGGYHLEALNIRSDHSPSFPSSILYFPLIVPPGLILNHSVIYSTSQHSFHEPGYQKAINLVSGICHSTSPGVLSTKHSITNGFSTTIGARQYTNGIMHSRVSFNSYNINAQIK
jgi:hypothetical protein